MIHRIGHLAAIVLAALAAAPAVAIPVIGNAGADDVTLGQYSATSIAFSRKNPANGNTSGFSTAFAAMGSDDWNFLGSTDRSTGARFTYGGLHIDFAKLTSQTTGTWSITNTDAAHDATLDLVMAIHAANASTAFQFDNLNLAAGQTLSGTWSIEWLNNGGNVPAFSNVAFFDRDLVLGAAQENGQGDAEHEVPEPASLTLLGLGLAAMTLLRKRGRA